MKLQKPETPDTTEEEKGSVDIPDAQHRATSATQSTQGDLIMTMVTHQIEVDGSEAWVRFGTQTSVGEHETPEEAKWRAIGFVQTGAMDAVKATVEEINKVGA